MATFVLIHGAASDSWYWHRLIPKLEANGHIVVTPDLPCEDDSATFEDYADVVVDAAGAAKGCVLVCQSLGGFTGPLACVRIDTRLLVMLNAMIPTPGESGGEWWANTGWSGPSMDTEEDIRRVFMHDLPEDVTAEAMKRPKDQSGTPMEAPWPLERWPEVPTKVLAGRDDHFFTLDFQRSVARERLGVDVDEIDGGHLVALSRPRELAARLVEYLSRVACQKDPRSQTRGVSRRRHVER